METKNSKKRKQEETIYHGDIKCQNSKCSNKAYFKMNGAYFCGVHAKGERTPLPKRSSSQKAEFQQKKRKIMEEEVEEAKIQNQKEGKKGKVVLSRMLMMKDPVHMKGFLKVFPNYKHQNRGDGFGCMRLSPKFMGPIDHQQPGLPPAKNLENFHQGSKCFSEEMDAKGNPSPVYIENRRKFYEDAEPHRHKFKGTEKNKNVPKYFVWIDKQGKEHHLTYIQSRQFYCNFYERIASKEEDFQKLKKLVEEGTNIQICGYDAFDIEGSPEKAYLDPSAPFGHERVLYTMLTEKPENFPWRKHKTFDF